MKGKLSENTESFTIIPRVTQISVMTLRTTESFLRETNEQKKAACYKRKTTRTQFTFDTVPSHKEVGYIILSSTIFY